jgi:hypothetical protein
MGGACGLMAIPASALELGDVQINSSLGQPLRASIAYALNPNEQLYNFCVYLRPGVAANGLPVLSKASVSIADSTILLTGSRAIREPMLTMQVSIDCPYTAHISREYTLMINPPTPVVEVRSDIQPSAAPVAAAPTRPAERTSRNIVKSPISESSRYLVQRGESLSEIASRISNRSIALWPAVDRIFAANPDAFMDGDMNRLKAGSWLDIPDLSATPVVAETAPEIAPVTETAAAANAGEFTAYSGYDAAATTVADEPPAPVAVETTEIEEPAISEPDTESADFSNLQPGDVVVGNDSPFVSPIGATDGAESIDIPDTAIVEPVVPPIAVIESSGPVEFAGKTSGSWSWLIWLGGTGLALILGLLLFGQRFRQKFGSVSVGTASEPLPKRRRTDASSRAQEAIPDVDFPVPDASPQAAYMTLDADFDDGSGLQDTADMDVAQDFGFSASSAFDDELDMVLPEGGDEEDSGTTDIIEPSARPDDPLVLDSEVLPNEGDDSEYDLSMIVDVTKQDVVELDATEKDLQAVQVDTANEANSDDYTLSQDVDYKILEQDYEDEFTATQALNAEIEKAAAELADRMDIDATGEMTAKLPENTQAQNDDINDSGVNDVTAEVTAEMPGVEDDATVEMPANDDDVTANMEVESGIIDTKKKKKAS